METFAQLSHADVSAFLGWQEFSVSLDQLSIFIFPCSFG